jgi:hypothetical protein
VTSPSLFLFSFDASLVSEKQQSLEFWKLSTAFFGLDGAVGVAIPPAATFFALLALGRNIAPLKQSFPRSGFYIFPFLI